MNNNYYTLLTYDNVNESIEYVQLPTNLRGEFLYKFNVELVPDFYDLSSWIEETVVNTAIDKLNNHGE